MLLTPVKLRGCLYAAGADGPPHTRAARVARCGDTCLSSTLQRHKGDGANTPQQVTLGTVINRVAGARMPCLIDVEAMEDAADKDQRIHMLIEQAPSTQPQPSAATPSAAVRFATTGNQALQLPARPFGLQRRAIKRCNSRQLWTATPMPIDADRCRLPGFRR